MTVLALLAGTGCGLGALFVFFGLREQPQGQGQGHGRGQGRWRWRDRVAANARSRRGDQQGTKRVVVAVSIGLAVAAITKWPVGGLLASALAGSWHTLFGQKSTAAAEVARIEAIATWTEMLRDTMAAASGLEQAVTTTSAMAPTSIRPALTSLAARIDSREVTLSEGLATLADELGDPTADLVVAALMSAADRRARSLGELLSALAASAREEATMRLRVQAGRARIRTAARIVTATTVLLAGGMVLFRRDFLSSYNGTRGQFVLAIVGIVFAAAFWWLTRMSEISSPERFLTGLRVRGGTAS
ncbi:MAG: pilus assembly protein TadB [Acidimicrobiia bacterium]|nr:pilus assembly protein TadB [Acidimicrobiia bacterium]